MSKPTPARLAKHKKRRNILCKAHLDNAYPKGKGQDIPLEFTQDTSSDELSHIQAEMQAEDGCDSQSGMYDIDTAPVIALEESSVSTT